jgi:hypothetical protein
LRIEEQCNCWHQWRLFCSWLHSMNKNKNTLTHKKTLLTWSAYR